MVASHAKARITLVGQASTLRERLQDWSAEFEIAGSNEFGVDDILGPVAREGTLRIWVVVSSKSQARLYFAAPTGDRFYVRDVALSAGLDEAGQETLVQVILSTAQAFENTRLTSSVEAIEATFGERTAIPTVADTKANVLRARGVVVTGKIALPSNSEWQPYVAAFYCTNWVNAEEFGQGPGGVLGLFVRQDRMRWRVAAQGQYRFPLVIERADFTLNLRTSVWSMVAGPDWPLTRTSRVGLGVGTGFERTAFVLNALKSSSVKPLPGKTHYRPFVDVLVRIETVLGEMSASALIGGRVAWTRTHYDIDDTPTLTPWLLSPYVSLEISY
jgi:hypothetical protein